jgi:TPR repeat protein
MGQPDSALGEGLFWMAEKLAWGYDGSRPSLEEALRLFAQAADLGVSDALIRTGQFQEYGKGTAWDPKSAVQNYQKAANAGNFFAQSPTRAFNHQSIACD